MDNIIIYTDGAAKGNPGPAGVGIVMTYKNHRKEIYKYLGRITNNMAELLAIKYALDTIHNRQIPIIIYSDSKYAIGCLQNLSWRPKKNVDIINGIKENLKSFKSVKFEHVPGHAGIPENERADYLANYAIKTKQSSE